MKFFAVIAILFSVVLAISGHHHYNKGSYNPHKVIKFKRCETVTTNAVKYIEEPVVKTTYVYSTYVSTVPSTYQVYITRTSSYVDYSTVCNKHPKHKY